MFSVFFSELQAVSLLSNFRYLYGKCIIIMLIES